MKKGIAASKGYAIGQVFIKENKEISIVERTIEDLEKEKSRLQNAIESSKNQLIQIKQNAEKELGMDKAAVFESYITLLEDPEFIGAVAMNIELGKINAEKAISNVIEMYTDIFVSMEDEYMRERAADIKDVGNRILCNLAGREESVLENLNENTVIVSHDLTPSDTAKLDKSKVVGFITNIGGRTSHSAIIARALEIPAVLGLKNITENVKNGDIVIVDGYEGIVLINPNEDTILEYRKKKEVYDKEREELKKLINISAVTKAGKHIEVSGNIDKAEDIHQVLENGGDGVGLFRTEFLYMNRCNMPSEEEQFQAYRYVAEKAEGKPVVIRTIDIGGDKKLSCLQLPNEINPFLGYRAIRICLDRKDVFKIQLRAVLRASAFGNIKIMFPMIASLEEFLDAKKILKECMDELGKEGKDFNKKLEVGIMVEVPAAAIYADVLAKYVDFFSIGTNDLIQYTLAVDRMNEKISYLYNSKHPAVLRLIKMTIDAAHKEGKWCGICGEAAADEDMIPIFVEYGIDEFSMNATSVLKAKQIIMNN